MGTSRDSISHMSAIGGAFAQLSGCPPDLVGLTIY
jgi:hypothetical protein